MKQKEIRDSIQKQIDYYGQYIVEEENTYCFCVSSICDSITSTIIEEVESLGYSFLHVQFKGENKKLVARFTYK